LENETKNGLHIEIVTPYELFYEKDVQHIILPSVDGEYGIWPGHTPVILALNPGEIRMAVEGEVRFAAISDGYAEIEGDQVIVVTGSAEWPENIDSKRAVKALERATERIRDPMTSKQELERSRRSILRAKARLKVFDRKKDPYSIG
jgi:F-type H+-transporting ATPase subunit epsilon